MDSERLARALVQPWSSRRLPPIGRASGSWGFTGTAVGEATAQPSWVDLLVHIGNGRLAVEIVERIIDLAVAVVEQWEQGSHALRWPH